MEININNGIYYNLDDIRSLYPNIFGINLSTRKLVLFLNISPDNYIYAYPKQGEWIISNDKYCKAKILLKKEWLTANTDANVNVNATTLANTTTLANVPKMIINGKELTMEIRTTGPISMDTILFRVKDVSIEFDIPKLRDTIVDKRTSYEEDIDYKKIITTGHTPYLYLTYTGFLKCIFISRGSKIVSDVQRWITSIIYKCQFGSKEDKITLVKNIVPEYSDIVCNIFSKFEFSCVYLLGIGNYKEYSNVYKFGRTNDFNRRYKEHAKTYNTIPTVCILQHVDIDYLSKAETDIKQYMQDINALLPVENHDELVSLTDKQVKSTMNMYKHISGTYSSKIDILQEQITLLQHQIELLKRDNKIKILEQEKELLVRDVTILTLEKKLLQQ